MKELFFLTEEAEEGNIALTIGQSSVTEAGALDELKVNISGSNPMSFLAKTSSTNRSFTFREKPRPNFGVICTFMSFLHVKEADCAAYFSNWADILHENTSRSQGLIMG